MAENRMRSAAQKRTEKFNNKHKIFYFNEGDYVLAKAFNFSQRDKKVIANLLALCEGPYIISKKIRGSTYILQYLITNMERGMYISTELKPYIFRDKQAQ